MPEQRPQDIAVEGTNFEKVDADAFCQQCGTVNPEGTILCKVCGNNLKEQRSDRITNAQDIPLGGAGPSRFRIFTGLLTVALILIAVLLPYSLPVIEDWLVSQYSRDVFADSIDLWVGENSQILDDLEQDLFDNPSSRQAMNDARANPINDSNYNGRYALFDGNRIVGEASLSKRGGRVFFVVRPRDFEGGMRGIAEIDGEGEERLAKTEVAGLRVLGEDYPAFGFVQKLSNGGHAAYAQSGFSDSTTSVVAYRIR